MHTNFTSKIDARMTFPRSSHSSFGPITDPCPMPGPTDSDGRGSLMCRRVSLLCGQVPPIWGRVSLICRRVSFVCGRVSPTCRRVSLICRRESQALAEVYALSVCTFVAMQMGCGSAWNPFVSCRPTVIRTCLSQPRSGDKVRRLGRSRRHATCADVCRS